jgi:hypothetical protein
MPQVIRTTTPQCTLHLVHIRLIKVTANQVHTIHQVAILMLIRIEVMMVMEAILQIQMYIAMVRQNQVPIPQVQIQDIQRLRLQVDMMQVEIILEPLPKQDIIQNGKLILISEEYKLSHKNHSNEKDKHDKSKHNHKSSVK